MPGEGLIDDKITLFFNNYTIRRTLEGVFFHGFSRPRNAVAETASQHVAVSLRLRLRFLLRSVSKPQRPNPYFCLFKLFIFQSVKIFVHRSTS